LRPARLAEPMMIGARMSLRMKMFIITSVPSGAKPSKELEII
jgi:hypothetical protein